MNNLKPKVSIILPIFNREDVIIDTLNSIKNQTFINFECILVDDGSSDNSLEVIKRFINFDKRFKLYKRPKNRIKGANACRNYGFEISKGEFIQWFDSDDLMFENKIEEKVKVLNEFINFDYVVCSGIEFKDRISNTLNKWDKITSENPILDHITGKVSLHTNGPLFRKSFLENENLFNEDLQRKQEWEFYTRLLFKSTNYFPLHKTLYYFRIHSGSINGLNSINTLASRVQANNLVFKNLLKEKVLLKQNPFLRKHFLYKYFYNLELTLASNSYKNIFLIVKGGIMVLNFSFIIKLTHNLIKKPSLFLIFKNK